MPDDPTNGTDLEERLPPWTRALLPCLGGGQRAAFLLRGTGMTFAELGERLGISRGRARILTESAVRRMTEVARRAALLHEHAFTIEPHVRVQDASGRCRVPEAMRKALDLPVQALALGVRPLNCLRDYDIRFVGDLVQRRERDLLRMIKLGRKSVREIEESLAGIGLHLGMDSAGWTRPQGGCSEPHLGLGTEPSRLVLRSGCRLGYPRWLCAAPRQRSTTLSTQ